MNTRCLVLCLLATGFSAGCTSTAHDTADSDRGRDCVFAREPSSWRVLDNRHLILWDTGRNDAYLVTLFLPLSNLSFTESLIFVDGDRDGRICGSSFDKIAVPDSTMPALPSAISSMRKVDKAELVEIGKQYKVKLVSEPKETELKQHDKKPHEE